MRRRQEPEHPSVMKNLWHIYDDRKCDYTYVGVIDFKIGDAVHLYNTDDGHTMSIETIFARQVEMIKKYDTQDSVDILVEEYLKRMKE